MIGRYRIRIVDLDTGLIVLDEEFRADKADAFKTDIVKRTAEKFRNESLKKEANDTEQE